MTAPRMQSEPATEQSTQQSAEHGVRGYPNDSSELTTLLGANLRRWRLRRGFSLEKLATGSGVSRSMLSQIELGKTTPTIRTLWRIVNALGVPFAALLEDGTSHRTRISRRAASKFLTSQNGSFTSRALLPFDKDRRVEFYELRIAPRSAENASPHADGTVETLVVSSGQLDLVLGTQHHQLSEGDCIAFDANVVHRYSNPSYVPTLVYLVITYSRSGANAL